MIIALRATNMKIGVYYKQENNLVLNSISEQAKKYGFILDNENPDVVFSVGGDGTFLRAVHAYIDRLDKVQFIGINSGSLGFFYDFAKEDIPEIFKKLKENAYKSREHSLLKGVATYKKVKEVIYALNEIRIENPFHTLICKVSINDEELEVFRGNGLIVSSTLGSSAYNKSLGGALVDNDLDALELTEVAAIENNIYRSLGSPLVVKGDKKISFACQVNKTVVGYDHLASYKDDELLNIDISYSEKKVKIIYSEDHSYVQKIRKSFVL